MQQEIIRKQREMEEKHMKMMMDAQNRHIETQNRINQQHLNHMNSINQNNNQNSWGNNPQNNNTNSTNNNNNTSNSSFPSMVWTPIDPNNPSHQYFLNR
jgi:hypothetical protein